MPYVKKNLRERMIKEICEVKCPYYDVCGLDPTYDCEAFKRLVKIYEIVDCDDTCN